MTKDFYISTIIAIVLAIFFSILREYRLRRKEKENDKFGR